MNDASITDIVSYWLGDSHKSPEKALARHATWYRGGTKVDAKISTLFESRVYQARAGDLSAWENSPDGALALVVLLDQFTRNVFRGSAKAYSGDELARSIAARAVGAGHDKSLSVPARIFFYHPFHHSETLDEQNRGVSLLKTLEHEASAIWGDYVRRSIKGFSGHRDVVVRFGRFPHRNVTLQRESTEEELIYLAAEPETYGQTKA